MGVKGEQKKKEKIRSKVIPLITKKNMVESEIAKKCLLNKETYTNEEAIEEYKKIIELREKYYNRERVDDYFMKFANCDNKSDADSKMDKFEESMNKIEKELGILETGKKGEEELGKTLTLFSDRVKLIRNARFNYDGIDVEIDVILVSTNGIFCIEVKNWKKNAIINDKGYLVENTGKKYNKERLSIDLASQMSRHKHCIRRILKDVCDENLDIHSILLWENENSRLIDEFNNIDICYRNTLEYQIFNEEKYNRVFEKNEVNDIYQCLLKNKLQERKYKLVVDNSFVKELKEAFLLDTYNEIEKLNGKIDIQVERINEAENSPMKYTVKKFGRGAGKVAKGIGITVGTVATAAVVVVAAIVGSSDSNN